MNSHQLQFLSMIEIEKTARKIHNSKLHESTQVTQRKQQSLLQQPSGEAISNRYATSSDLKFNTNTFNDTIGGTQSLAKTKKTDKLRGSSLFTFHNDKEMQTQYNLQQIKVMNSLKDELKFHKKANLQYVSGTPNTQSRLIFKQGSSMAIDQINYTNPSPDRKGQGSPFTMAKNSLADISIRSQSHCYSSSFNMNKSSKSNKKMKKSSEILRDMLNIKRQNSKMSQFDYSMDPLNQYNQINSHYSSIRMTDMMKKSMSSRLRQKQEEKSVELFSKKSELQKILMKKLH